MDEDIEKIIRGLIGAERSRRASTIARAVNRVTDEFTSKGAIGHGRFPVMLDLECAKEYEWRGRKWLEITRRVASDTLAAWTPARSAHLRQLLSSELIRDWEELVALFRQKAIGAHNPHIDQLDAAKDRMAIELEHEFELLVVSQERTRIPLVEQLQPPRYSAVKAGWDKSHLLLAAEPPDFSNAAKEAIGAVEQMARIVTGRGSATLGDAVKELRNSGRVPAPLLKGVEEIWGVTSEVPGVRHGSATMSLVDAGTARYIIAQAGAAIALLLAKDTPATT